MMGDVLVPMIFSLVLGVLIAKGVGAVMQKDQDSASLFFGIAGTVLGLVIFFSVAAFAN